MHYLVKSFLMIFLILSIVFAQDTTLTISPEGNVGIGTTNPTEKLVVGIDLGEALSGNRITIGNISGPSALNIGTDINNRAFLFWDHVNKHLAIGTRIDSGQFGQTLVLKNGKIGMGMSNPQQKLQVNGVVYSMNGGFRFPDGTLQTTAAASNGQAGGTLDEAYDYGGAGAGRTIIADAGAFEVNGMDGVVFNGIYGSGSIPAEGGGTRMMWYPAKASFRAGNVSNLQWNADSIGLFSMALGYNNVASGFVSTALGGYTSASGLYSTAMGINSIASGNYSTAIGTNPIAAGNYATALGTNIEANGDYSVAIGSNVSASGEGSFIIGDKSTSTDYNNTTDSRFVARFANGYYLFTNSATTVGVALAANSNSWAVISDSSKKENFKVVNGEEILNKIGTFELTSWNYIGQDKTQFRHYGPMAQDFYKAFGHDGVGSIGNDTTIASADFDGINFIAIQALGKRTVKNEERIERNENRIVKSEKLMAVNQQNIVELTTAVMTLLKENKALNEKLAQLETLLEERDAELIGLVID
jgi:hypothetical protein